MSERKGKRGGGREPAADADGPWIDPDEARPRLALVAPDRIGPEVLTALDILLKAAAPAAFLFAPEALPADDREAAIAAVRAACLGAGTACLLVGDPKAVISHGLDGVLLPEEADVAAARKLLGLERLVGAACGLSRHGAMLAGESGADFVQLGTMDAHADLAELVELATWWADLFVIPLAVAAPAEQAAIVQLAEAGADFLMVGGEFWSRPADEAAALLADMAASLAAIERPSP